VLSWESALVYAGLRRRCFNALDGAAGPVLL
jgi:hypothetical protein